MKATRAAIAVYVLLGIALVQMWAASFRAGSYFVAAAVTIAVVDRRQENGSYFANRGRAFDLLFLLGLLVTVAVLAFVVPSPQ